MEELEQLDSDEQVPEGDTETRGHGDAELPDAEVVEAPVDAEAQGPDAAEIPDASEDDLKTETDPEDETAGPVAMAGSSENAESIAAEVLLAAVEAPTSASSEDSQLKALLEAIVYITEEPLTLAQIATALAQPRERVQWLLDELVAEYDKPEHGVTMREVAGGYKMTTKPEHHETVRNFVRSLKPPLKLSLPALETLAVIAYKQPVTAPEIMEIRGVQGTGVLKTLLDRKLIAAAGRKNVIGKPILYKTTKDFLVQFGLKDLSELPSLKEFEEIRRMAVDGDAPAPVPEPAADQNDG
jgi:segregation and condensation protein B